MYQQRHNAFMQWHSVYDLRADIDRVANIQRATLTTLEFGIEPTHGLLGSAEWWQRIASGNLPVHRLEGVIMRVHGEDLARFDMVCQDGLPHSFESLRTSPDAALDPLYREGQSISVDTVWQEARQGEWGLPHMMRMVIAIRIAA